MNELPMGTVSLLFSDIEGSTALLFRLGPAYVDALDAHRKVLRSAWTAHGGTELGTEGDSFFVVFPSALAAAVAAVQAQRALAAYPWPAGESIRVRMGIHTGSPDVHEDGYVGIDVHRAARIAHAAHGGQVLVSSATAELVVGSLPGDVRLADLGSHTLKDLPRPEHLFQLQAAGLPSRAGPLAGLSRPTSLPRAPTPLVGREGELAELTALLQTSGVRLLTLTGPGGSGKTRLGVALAHRLSDEFGDGACFVPLASVVSSDVMWATIAEVLDVPSESRAPPALFRHLTHRSVLLVLDNLEQLVGADFVVAELLAQVPDVVVIATSRRPLHVPAEFEHPVPPLELPAGDDLAAISGSGAVQLFVQQTTRVQPSFTVTAENAGEVSAICRRLDGLPLAVELAAARSKLLSPRALLRRLDSALDIEDVGTRGPRRHKTLRDTISWSYDLLAPPVQVFFRKLGVFSGGADLPALQSVMTAGLTEQEALGVVAELLDSSLVLAQEGLDGEPRVSMLQTIRDYARDLLRAHEELDELRALAAEHFLGLVTQLSRQLSQGGDGIVEARRRFELEHRNIRDALRWAFTADELPPAGPADLDTGLRLCAELGIVWWHCGQVAEAREWLDRAAGSAPTHDSVELARCRAELARVCRLQGNLDLARARAAEAVATLRRLDAGDWLPRALLELAQCEQELGDLTSARATMAEAVALGRDPAADPRDLAQALARLARLEARAHNFALAQELGSSASAINADLAGGERSLTLRHNTSWILQHTGRVEDARQQISEQIPDVLRLAYPEQLLGIAEDYAAVLAELGLTREAARLLGAVDSMRERQGTPRHPSQYADIQPAFDIARSALADGGWEKEYAAGHARTVEHVLGELYRR